MRRYKKIEIVSISEKSFAEVAQNAVAKAKVTTTERAGLEAGSAAKRTC